MNEEFFHRVQSSLFREREERGVTGEFTMACPRSWTHDQVEAWLTDMPLGERSAEFVERFADMGDSLNTRFEHQA